MAIKNSISTTLEKIISQSNNSVATYKGISEAITTKTKDAVTVTIENEDNPEETTTIQVPSFGYLSNAIERIDASLKTLANVNEGSGSMIRLSDGSYRKIMTAKVPSEAPTVTETSSVTEFKFKSNWFFEDMMNPLLYVNYDLTGQVSVSTRRVLIQRYLLSCVNDTQLAWFESIKNRNDVVYSEFLYGIIQNKVQYVLDEEIKDLPIRGKKYVGTFDVQDINTLTVSEIVDGVEKNYNVREYILNTLNYTDTTTGYTDTMYLTENDYVDVNTYPTSTRYQVVKVDNSRMAVQLKLIEGYEVIQKGTDVLKISATQDSNIYAEIPIGYDERTVCFIKPIDNDSNIPAANWSPGISFYTNELTYTDSNGELKTLGTFYKKNVVDIGKMLLSYSDDFYPSIRDGIVPNAPQLYEDNFKVVQINKQITDTDSTEKIGKLVSEKLQLQQSIDNATNTISSLQTKIRTTNYLSTQDRLNDEKELESQIQTRDANTVSYGSVVNQIQSLYTSDTANKVAKYHIRGFWAMPEEQESASTGSQAIIKFKYRYRYLSESGSANNQEEYTFTDTVTTDDTTTQQESKAVYSNWELGETVLRERKKNTSTGRWYWADVTNTDSESIDINQLDIAITKGEMVEIQVKSVSEAGYPSNPLESDWSESVVISFPPELSVEGIDGIISQNKQDLARVDLQKELNSLGIRTHVTDSFATNDTYFAHNATSIASGFLSPEQTPITLFDKLKDLQQQVTSLIEQINQVQGEIKVELVDEDGDVVELIEGGTTYVSAGYYEDWVNEKYPSDTDIYREVTTQTSTSGSATTVKIWNRAGAIMTKNFNIKITNTNQSGLMLLSKLPGSRFAMVPNTITTAKKLSGSDYIQSDYAFRYDLYDNIISDVEYDNDYYQNIGRYDLVPINLQGSQFIDFKFASPNMYQSAQARGQFIYSRFRDISDTYNLYATKGKSDYDVHKRYSVGNEIIDKKIFYKKDSEGIFVADSNMMYSEFFGSNRQCSPIAYTEKKSTTTDDSTNETIDVCTETYFTLKGRANSDYTVSSDSFEDLNGMTYTVNETFMGNYYKDDAKVVSGDYNSKSFVRYNSLTGSSLETEPIHNGIKIDSTDITTKLSDDAKVFDTVLYRIPRTYKKPNNGVASSIKGGKMSIRLANMNQSVSDLQKYLNRIQKVQSNKTSTQTEIEPRIQTAYGFGDLDYRADTSGNSDSDDKQYLTTHKIGFLPEDQFAQNSGAFTDMGFNTCNSYLFLNPIAHENIQVDGDSRSSYKQIDYGEQNALLVPLTYQARMTTYPTYINSNEVSGKVDSINKNTYKNGIIFGDSANTKYSSIVQNTYFSNIIGIDIWVDKNTPKQYDIIVYSKYAKSTTDVDKDNTKSQKLIDALKDASGNIQILAKNSTKSTVN